MFLTTIVVLLFIFMAYVIGMILRGLGGADGDDATSGFANFIVNVLIGAFLLAMWFFHSE